MYNNGYSFYITSSCRILLKKRKSAFRFIYLCNYILKMKKRKTIFLLFGFIIMIPLSLYSQYDRIRNEFGINAGGFTNFQASRDYSKNQINVLYIAPYILTHSHEFSLAFAYPLSTDALAYPENKIDPLPGFIAGYKFYLFDMTGNENVFLHYSFQYLHFSGNLDNNTIQPPEVLKEKDMYINNLIGLGYTLYFDAHQRFGMYYIIDYIISQYGYQKGSPEITGQTWTTDYSWNRLSTHIGFSFKLTDLKKSE